MMIFVQKVSILYLLMMLFAMKCIRGSSWRYPFQSNLLSLSKRASQTVVSSSSSNSPLANLYTYPDHKTLDSFFLFSGKVHRGYGRGSKKLGFPTANLPQFEDQLNQTSLVNGVYYGLGQVEGDKAVHLLVANIGYSPTFVGQENRQRIIEAHLIDYIPVIDDSESTDFYDKNLKLVFVGFLRKEKKFSSLDELKTTISQDVVMTREIFDYLHSQGLLTSLRLQFFPDSISVGSSNSNLNN